MVWKVMYFFVLTHVYRGSVYSCQDLTITVYTLVNIVNLCCCNLVNCQYKCTLAIISMCFLFVWYKEQYPLSVTASVIDQFNYLPITITQTNTQHSLHCYNVYFQPTQHNTTASLAPDAGLSCLFCINQYSTRRNIEKWLGRD